MYSTQKTFDDHKESLDADQKGRLEEALGEAKKALEGEDAAAMDAAIAKLTEAAHSLAEKMYQQPAGAASDAEPGAAASGDAEDEVIDAEYVDVEESTEEPVEESKEESKEEN